MHWSFINVKYNDTKHIARNSRKKFPTEYRTYIVYEAIRTKHAASTPRKMIAHPSFRLFSLRSPISRMVINVKKGRALTSTLLTTTLPRRHKYKKQPSPLRYPLSSVSERGAWKTRFETDIWSPIGQWQWRMFVRKKNIDFPIL